MQIPQEFIKKYETKINNIIAIAGINWRDPDRILLKAPDALLWESNRFNNYIAVSLQDEEGPVTRFTVNWCLVEIELFSKALANIDSGYLDIKYDDK